MCNIVPRLSLNRHLRRPGYHDHAMTENPASPRPQPPDDAVTYRHAVVFGLVAGGIVLITTAIFMRFWQNPEVLLSSVLFTVGTFVAVSGFTGILVWYDRNKKKPDEPPSFPVLK